jgi:sulfonate transport system substrate-binding protein
VSRFRQAIAVLWLLSILPPPGGLRAQSQAVTIRVGHLPNITQAQALLGEANGAFEKALAPGARIDWKVFNAGPSIIEAIFADQLDLAYVGPNPAINGFVRSEGQALRIIAGAASGGAALIVRADSGIKKPEDFHGRRVASPQLGNTQDVALRTWLRTYGLTSWERGGDVQVMPVASPDQITLFLKKQLDAAWAPEPWASRLIHEANGRLLLDERTLWPGGRFVAAQLIVRTDFLRQHRDLVLKWVRVHLELTDWITQNSQPALRMLNEEIRRETGMPLPEDVLEDALSRMEFTVDPIRSSLLKDAQDAYEAGMLGRRRPSLNGIYDLSILNQILREQGAPPIQ